MSSAVIIPQTSVVQVTSGSVTFPSCSAKIGVFHITPGTDNSAKSMEFMSRKYKPGSTIRIPASQGMMSRGENANGMWHQSTFAEVADGDLLGLSVSVSKRGKAWADGFMVCRVRRQGSLYRLNVRLFDRQVLPSYIGRNEPMVTEDGRYCVDALSGSFDILQPSEFEEWGLRFPDYFSRKFFIEEEVNELFDKILLKQAETKLVTSTVVNSSGQAVAIQEVVQKKRIVILNRREVSK